MSKIIKIDGEEWQEIQKCFMHDGPVATRRGPAGLQIRCVNGGDTCSTTQLMVEYDGQYRRAFSVCETHNSPVAFWDTQDGRYVVCTGGKADCRLSILPAPKEEA